jgi:hypothetical protein
MVALMVEAVTATMYSLMMSQQVEAVAQTGATAEAPALQQAMEV